MGTLIEKKNNPDLTYNAMNRDSCINMAIELNKFAKEQDTTKRFVMISSEKPPPFLEEYQTSKREAEDFLLSEECSNLKSTIIRPGFLVDKDGRWWSIPLGVVVDIGYMVNEKVYKKTPLASQLDFLFPAKSVQLRTVAHIASEGLMGNLDESFITNDMIMKIEDGLK